MGNAGSDSETSFRSGSSKNSVYLERQSLQPALMIVVLCDMSFSFSNSNKQYSNKLEFSFNLLRT